MFKSRSTPSSKSEQDLPRPLRTWIWVVIAACAIVCAAITLDWYFDDHLVVPDIAKWGQVGDYFGGVLNPFLGFLTIVLLTTSLRQNQIALQQTQEELIETRKAIELAGSNQAATELALKKQIEIADQARDMNNAVAIFNAYRARYSHAMSDAERYPAGSHPWNVAKVAAEKLNSEVVKIEAVVNHEKRRLEEKYASEISGGV